MTDAELPEPPRAQEKALERLSTALYDLLHARALSVGILDIALEDDGWFIDVELLFSNGPDMGMSFNAEASSCRFCELIGTDQERWIDAAEITDVQYMGANVDMAEISLLLLSGVLDARRPLLTKVDTPPS